MTLFKFFLNLEVIGGSKFRFPSPSKFCIADPIVLPMRLINIFPQEHISQAQVTSLSLSPDLPSFSFPPSLSSEVLLCSFYFSVCLFRCPLPSCNQNHQKPLCPVIL